MQITIHDFSGVYSEQKFMQSLRESTKALWLDGTRTVKKHLLQAIQAAIFKQITIMSY
ncbi:hypothetical protein [uncultured Fibrobacter sp.]|uniref:hypothetical protein n=1 Tax=uncultured Fibrobacter sp. TaxID=261512 RepID=UPI0025E88FCA|nr:hypothetical protein [uncultured Fibrobacter sp.]